MQELIGMIFPYVSVMVFLGGAIYRVGSWATAPKKLNWKLYPVPRGSIAEGAFILEEWASFKMLFRHNRAIWLGSYCLHLSLVALGLWFLFLLLNLRVPFLIRLGVVGLFCSSVYLFVARLWIPQMRVISTPVEFFNLAIFIAIGALGWEAVSLGLGEEFRQWTLSILSLKPKPLPQEPTLIWCILLWEFFLAYLPFSRMFHMASKYFAFHKSRWYNPYEATGH